jgi:hypothetical protein
MFEGYLALGDIMFKTKDFLVYVDKVSYTTGESTTNISKWQEIMLIKPN